MMWRNGRPSGPRLTDLEADAIRQRFAAGAAQRTADAQAVWQVLQAGREAPRGALAPGPARACGGRGGAGPGRGPANEPRSLLPLAGPGPPFLRPARAKEPAPEPPHPAFPPCLEPHEAHADLHDQERDGGHHDDREAVAVAGHHSSPEPRWPTALEMIPPRFREDMYCSVSLNACSSVIPLSFKVR